MDASPQLPSPLEETQRSGLSLGLAVWLFSLLGLGGALYARWAWTPHSVTREGTSIQSLFDIILGIILVAFILVHLLLGYFVIRYRARGREAALYFPHHTALEVTYTAVPAAVLVALSVAGMVLWSRVHAPPPPDAFVVEVRGEQFGWSARYPGPDGKLGRVDNRIPAPFNVDPQDPASRDDVVSPQIYLVANRPNRVLLRTRDVQHSFWVPAFRLKKDLLPGATTELVFTPTQTGEFDLACAELCGVGHYTMAGKVRVVTQEEFDRWMRQQARRK
ncbi:MAG: cytochrome c oxidase subunit II [Armatimonadota bacterium]|nr:cytochrome c oxidase subunit II [Armatimonadota bacterium]MDR7395991.1 cytochrome c oxidase subunit II [Armatimonadota bacterium]MDR7398797.1 cytochrome c oxidase subunit II [Armatimonadota bacterium]MDR7407494.1 cytochrome c oxidase subunit II [Armatimonadota bacterium]MDR7408149.1 cytochrome c oxidase subunit II [Armatimonadota bacterium]